MQWLITQKTEDRIELITRQMLETMVEDTQYLAVYFCEYAIIAFLKKKIMIHGHFEPEHSIYTHYVDIHPQNVFALFFPPQSPPCICQTSLRQIHPNPSHLVRENHKNQPAYCRSLCTPIRSQITNHKKDVVIDSYLQRKRNEIAKQGTRIFVTIFTGLYISYVNNC